MHFIKSHSLVNILTSYHPGKSGKCEKIFFKGLNTSFLGFCHFPTSSVSVVTRQHLC